MRLLKGMDGAGRHFARAAIVNPTEFVMPLRPEDGAFYDGTAALNSQLINATLKPAAQTK